VKRAFFNKRAVYAIFKNKSDGYDNEGRYQEDGKRFLNKSKLPQYNDPHRDNK